ncbi:hypothetical protein D7294_14840 [Streptomyces hoynatensis]|uniref:RloB domain-containing protein n=1 Tax=Streptomyces hoynatensis TaxID=1141874 RepID=A0A3A9Z0C9_9ACTN|nr:hypothetical protein D7294_14840 [Streptomyces hoynatensis]
MGRGKPLKRGGPKRPELRRVLVYCEGERTEDQYFRGLRSDLRGLPVQVVVGPHSAAVERAGALRAAAAPGRLGHQANPWTDVDVLVEGLLAQRRQARA